MRLIESGLGHAMIYIFDTIELDVEKHELRRRGELVPVEPQVFSLLVHLVRERERVVSKDELIEVVWEGRFVSDSAVSSRIKSARQAIGDDGQAQRLIKTVHGTGFRFVAEVETREIEPRLTAAPVVPASAGKPVARKRSGLVWGLCALIVGLIGIGLAVTLGPDSPSAQADQIRVAVMPVRVATGNAEQDWAELGLMSLVSHKLAQEAAVSTVSPRSVVEGAGSEEEEPGEKLDIPAKLADKLRQTEGVSHFVLSRLTAQGARLHLDMIVRRADGTEVRAGFDGEKVPELADLMVRRIVAALPGAPRLAIQPHTSPEDPFVAEAYARGLAYALQGKAEEARNLFAVAVEQDPGDIWLRYEYALSTRQMGDLEGAEEQLTGLQAEAAQNGDADAHVSILNALGIVAMLRHNDDAARETFEKALPLSDKVTDHTRSAAILINLGILERRRRNFDQAEIYLTRAFTEYDAAGISAPPGALLNTMALLRIEQHRSAEAVQYLDRAMQRFQLDGNERFMAAVKNNLGDLRESAGDYDGAFAYYREALATRQEVSDPFGTASSLYSLANLSILTGRLEDAEAYARDLLKNGEGRSDAYRQAQAHSFLGRIAGLRGDADFARQHHRRAVDLFTGMDRADDAQADRLRLARLDHRNGDRAAARKAVQAVLVWARSEETDAAVMDGEATLADFALVEGDPVAACQHAEASVEAARKLPEANKTGLALVRLAEACLAKGDTDAAVSALNEAGALVPNDAAFFRAMAKLSQARGQLVEASVHLKKAKSLAGELWSADDEAGLVALAGA